MCLPTAASVLLIIYLLVTPCGITAAEGVEAAAAIQNNHQLSLILEKLKFIMASTFDPLSHTREAVRSDLLDTKDEASMRSWLLHQVLVHEDSLDNLDVFVRIFWPPNITSSPPLPPYPHHIICRADRLLLRGTVLCWSRVRYVSRLYVQWFQHNQWGERSTVRTSPCRRRSAFCR